MGCICTSETKYDQITKALNSSKFQYLLKNGEYHNAINYAHEVGGPRALDNSRNYIDLPYGNSLIYVVAMNVNGKHKSNMLPKLLSILNKSGGISASSLLSITNERYAVMAQATSLLSDSEYKLFIDIIRKKYIDFNTTCETKHVTLLTNGLAVRYINDDIHDRVDTRCAKLARKMNNKTLNMVTNTQDTALWIAVYGGYCKTLKVLLSRFPCVELHPEKLMTLDGTQTMAIPLFNHDHRTESRYVESCYLLKSALLCETSHNKEVLKLLNFCFCDVGQIIFNYFY